MNQFNESNISMSNSADNDSNQYGRGVKIDKVNKTLTHIFL